MGLNPTHRINLQSQTGENVNRHPETSTSELAEPQLQKLRWIKPAQTGVRLPRALHSDEKTHCIGSRYSNGVRQRV